MKITAVKTVLLTAPAGHDPSLLKLRTVRSASFIEIHTDTDLVGIGETYAGYHAPEIVPAIVEFFEPILVGLADAEIQPRRLWERMYRAANFWARNGVGTVVLAGIEAALWDLRGKMLGVPVWELLGGRLHDSLPGYATGSISDHPWDELLRKFDRYRDAGFHAAKVASGWYDGSTGRSFRSTSPQAWVEVETDKLTALRRHVGPDFGICLDGHMSSVAEGQTTWDAAIALAVLRALEPFDLVFFEEPLHYNDLPGYEALCGGTSVKVAGGECLTTREEFAIYAERRAFDIAQPDASFIGIGPFLDVAAMFAERKKQVATHAWSAGAGVMANIHAAFAVPNVRILELPPLAGPLHTEVYADGYRFENGRVLPPQAPGLGVRLPASLKERYPFVPGSGEWNTVPGGRGRPR